MIESKNDTGRKIKKSIAGIGTGETACDQRKEPNLPHVVMKTVLKTGLINTIAGSSQIFYNQVYKSKSVFIKEIAYGKFYKITKCYQGTICVEGFNDDFLTKKQKQDSLDLEMVEKQYVRDLSAYIEILKSGIVK